MAESKSGSDFPRLDAELAEAAKNPPAAKPPANTGTTPPTIITPGGSVYSPPKTTSTWSGGYQVGKPEPKEADKIDPRRVVVDAASARLTIDQIPWLKLVWLSRMGTVEIGGFCLCESDDPLHVTDIHMVKATCTTGHVDFDDEALADHIAYMTSDGTQAAQCSRIWWHKHPGNSATPSGEDKFYFDEHFCPMDWHVMLIRARGGAITATLRVKTGGLYEETEDFDGNVTRGDRVQKPLWVDIPLKVEVCSAKGWNGVALEFDDVHPDLMMELPFDEWKKEYDECCIIPPPPPKVEPRGFGFAAGVGRATPLAQAAAKGSAATKPPASGEKANESEAKDDAEGDDDTPRFRHPGRVRLDADQGKFYDHSDPRWWQIAFMDEDGDVDWESIRDRYGLDGTEMARLRAKIQNPDALSHELTDAEIMLEAFYKADEGNSAPAERIDVIGNLFDDEDEEEQTEPENAEDIEVVDGVEGGDPGDEDSAAGEVETPEDAEGWEEAPVAPEGAKNPDAHEDW